MTGPGRLPAAKQTRECPATAVAAQIVSLDAQTVSVLARTGRASTVRLAPAGLLAFPAKTPNPPLSACPLPASR